LVHCILDTTISFHLLSLANILIFVDAKKKEIIKNLKRRKNYNAKIIKILKKFQLPLKYKKKKSNFVIKNNFKIQPTKNNVKLLKNNIFGLENSKLTIGIRPENLKIISNNLKSQSKSFTAKIVEKSFMGDTMLYSINLNENYNNYHISVSDIKNSPNPNIGDEISVGFEEDDVVGYYEE